MSIEAETCGREALNVRKKNRLRRCKHFGRNKCLDCPEPNATDENCDVLGRAQRRSTKNKQ